MRRWQNFILTLRNGKLIVIVIVLFISFRKCSKGNRLVSVV